MKAEYLNKSNVLSSLYKYDASISSLRVVKKYYSFSFRQIYKRKIMSEKREDIDQTPHSSAYHLGLHCLSLSHKNDRGSAVI